MLSICAACTTAYAPAAACPHCGSGDYFEEGSMPKNTVHGGASNKHLPPAPASTSYLVGESGPELFPGEDLPVAVMAAVADGLEIVAVPAPEPEPEPVPEVVEVVPPSVYSTWLLRALRDECVRRGLPASGGKDDLVARLAASDAAAAEVRDFEKGGLVESDGTRLVTEGGEQPSPGSSTSTSSESLSTRPEPNGPADPKPAPTTESL